MFTTAPSQTAVQVKVNDPKFSFDGKVETVSFAEPGEIEYTNEKASLPFVAVSV